MIGNRRSRLEGLEGGGGIGKMGWSLRDLGGSGLEGNIEGKEDLGLDGASYFWISPGWKKY